MEIKLKQAVEKECAHATHLENEAEAALAEHHANHADLFPAEAVGRFAVAMARTSKQDFVSALDLGVPLDPPSAGSEDVLLLYQHPKAVPENDNHDHSTIPHLDMPEAIGKCDFLNILLTDHSGNRNQCIAIVPQYESYHLQKWMRINTDEKGQLDSNSKLQMVSRGYKPNGANEFEPPALATDTRKHWAMLLQFLQTVDDVLAELKPILEKIAIDNTVIVMTCNFGQAQLLMNFVCAAQSRKLDISNVIVFTTDQETTDLAHALGLTAYYDHRVRIHIIIIIVMI